MLDRLIGQEQGLSVMRAITQGSLKCPLILTGPDGVGRRFSVQLAMREIGARKERDRAASEAQLDAGVHPDWHEVSGAENPIGVDEIRELLSKIDVSPVRAKYRFVLVDYAHRMTAPAADALLKTLEEPPAHVRFFLVCPTANMLISTIRSRCGRAHYGKLPDQIVLDRLAELEQDDLRAQVCCRYAQGSLGSALKYWASGKLALRSKVLQALKASMSGDWATVCQAVDSAEKEMPDFALFLERILADLQAIQLMPERITNLDMLSELRVLAVPEYKLAKLVDGYYALPRDPSISTYSLHLKCYLIAGHYGT